MTVARSTNSLYSRTVHFVFHSKRAGAKTALEVLRGCALHEKAPTRGKSCKTVFESVAFSSRTLTYA